MTRFIQHHTLYERIPMKSSSVLPDEGFGEMTLELSDGLTFQVYCNPRSEQTYAPVKHRVMVICSCGKHVPFGRMGQHYRIGKCNA
jgi:hypothetical protein